MCTTSAPRGLVEQTGRPPVDCSMCGGTSGHLTLELDLARSVAAVLQPRKVTTIHTPCSSGFKPESGFTKDICNVHIGRLATTTDYRLRKRVCLSFKRCATAPTHFGDHMHMV